MRNPRKSKICFAPGMYRGPFTVFLNIFMVIMALVVLYPFYNAVLISMMPQADYLRQPFTLWPENFDFSSYKYVLFSSNVFAGMKISAFVTVFGVAYNMLLTTMTAYALSKPFWGRRIVSYLFIFAMYFSGGLIPQYLLTKSLGLIDSLWVMILPTGISFTYMLIIRRNFEELPKELEESAMLDGANDFVIFWRILLPLCLPILATFGLYYAVERWNEWWNAMMFIKDASKLPLQYILRELIQNSTIATDSAAMAGVVKPFDEGIKMACTIVSILPIMIIYPFLQKYFISDLTVGAVKG